METRKKPKPKRLDAATALQTVEELVLATSDVLQGLDDVPEGVITGLCIQVHALTSRARRRTSNPKK